MRPLPEIKTRFIVESVGLVVARKMPNGTIRGRNPKVPYIKKIRAISHIQS